MSFRFILLLFILLTVLLPVASQAQGIGNSPYSEIGIGDLIPSQSVQNMGAGGVSVAGFNREYIQLSNPASSVNKKGLYTDSLVKWEGAGTAQYKVLSSGNNLETYTGANFRYFAFMLPIGKVWNTTVSMQPFSVKDHSYIQTLPVQGDPNHQNIQYSYDGKGGIYQIALNNGWGVSKNLSVGLGLAYLFGPATTTTTSVLITNPYASIQNDVQYGVSQRVNHKGASFKPGMHYRKELYKWKDSLRVPSGVFWNMGSTLQFFTPMQLSVNTYKIRKSSSGSVSDDSLIGSSIQYANLPAQFTLGFSIDRPNRWMMGIEGSVADWSHFQYGNISSDAYKVGWSVSVGGEYRPTTRKQWRAATYRLGFNFTSLPYLVTNNVVNDMSGSLGMTLPVGVRGASGASFPKINFAVIVGQRGTLSTENIQELYVRMHVSILITDKWFIKRRIQ